MLQKTFANVRQSFADDFTLASLRTFIIAWAILVIIIVLLTKNKWLLAGIAAYEVLP